jgi:hypothetical protein
MKRRREVEAMEPPPLLFGGHLMDFAMALVLGLGGIGVSIYETLALGR